MSLSSGQAELVRAGSRGRGCLICLYWMKTDNIKVLAKTEVLSSDKVLPNNIVSKPDRYELHDCLVRGPWQTATDVWRWRVCNWVLRLGLACMARSLALHSPRRVQRIRSECVWLNWLSTHLHLQQPQDLQAFCLTSMSRCMDMHVVDAWI